MATINLTREEKVEIFKRQCRILKPSDEQMDALRYVTNFDYGGV